MLLDSKVELKQLIINEVLFFSNYSEISIATTVLETYSYVCTYANFPTLSTILVEYDDCKSESPPTRALDIIIICIRLQNFSLGDLANKQYSFTAITLRSTQTLICWTSLGPMYKSNRNVNSLRKDYCY